MSIFGGGITVWNGIVFIKSAEVVDADHIVDFRLVSNTVYPPLVPGFFHVVPVEKRVSPKLTVSGKSIGWASGNFDWTKVFIKLEFFRVCPNVSAVIRNINRQIANNFYIIFFCICFLPVPLIEK